MVHDVPSSSALEPTPIRVELKRADERHAELCFQGELTLSNAGALWDELHQRAAAFAQGATLDFNLSGLTRVDGAGMALLVHARSELQQRGVHCALSGIAPATEALARMYEGEPRVDRGVRRKARSAFEQIGESTLLLAHEGKLALAFIGQLSAELLAVFKVPRSANLRDVPSTMERTGADALPIVLLINFLVGLVMAFQASVQLKRFGANILVADLIGISMTRELGPLMTAIVVCGRSGAAYAAELGTMAVNEEIDALRMLGLSPMRYLVLPRVLGMMLVLPLLACFADVMGIIGGFTVALTRLDLTATAYFRQTVQAVKLWDVYSGVIKAGVFAVCIALIACQQGLASSGGAEGVGKRTTAAVVASLFTLILVDALFTVAFRLTGL